MYIRYLSTRSKTKQMEALILFKTPCFIHVTLFVIKTGIVRELRVMFLVHLTYAEWAFVITFCSSWCRSLLFHNHGNEFLLSMTAVCILTKLSRNNHQVAYICINDSGLLLTQVTGAKILLQCIFFQNYNSKGSQIC